MPSPRILPAVLSLVLASFLAACGGDSGPPSPESLGNRMFDVLDRTERVLCPCAAELAEAELTCEELRDAIGGLTRSEVIQGLQALQRDDSGTYEQLAASLTCSLDIVDAALSCAERAGECGLIESQCAGTIADPSAVCPAPPGSPAVALPTF